MANAQRTIVKKITLGVPVRKVTGAAAQAIGDLTDVDTSGLIDKGVLQYNINTAKFEVTTAPTGLTLSAGNF
tara:strand:+ start:640 stop:855 length:216 start_codon:yes stop_codon:yes gene_type:complete